MLELPRSVVLAAWGSAVAAGSAAPADATRAVTGTDEPHGVEVGATTGGAPTTTPASTAATDLAGLLAELSGSGVVLRAVLPAPGDPTGLPGPPLFNAVALDAGEAVVLPRPSGYLGLVPRVTRFGSVWEPGALVTWVLSPVGRPAPPDLTLADADRELRAALAEATRALADLDLARWREDAADRIVAVRDGALSRTALPPGTPAEAVGVATTASRVRAIVALAAEDDGTAVTGAEASARARWLRDVDAVARRALAAAASAPVRAG